MYRPIKLKCIKSGQILGGAEDQPYASERIIRKEPGTSRKDQFPDKFRPESGSKIELVASSVDELKKFIVENTYENLFGELGNRVGLTDFEAIEYQLSGHWVISATMWPMEPAYVRAATISYPSSRVTSGFQADTTEVAPVTETPTAGAVTGSYVLVGKMGERGVSRGKHWHLDEYPDEGRGFERQIPPRGAQGRPSDITARVGKTPVFDLAKSWIFGQQPSFTVTSNYGVPRGNRRHKGVDCVSYSETYLFIPVGTFKTQEGVTGYGTYVWFGRFGIGHMDLMTSGSKVAGLSTRLGFGEANLGLASLFPISEPQDNYSTQERFT
jgi:hypothetical protein